MDNKERLDLLNNSYQKLLTHSHTIQNCSKQADDLLSRLEEIKQKLIKKDVDVADDFKEIHEQHIQNTHYIQQLELYENESVSFKQTIDRICGKPLSDPIWFQHLKKKYLNKAILYELYRQGRFKAAQLFLQESKLKEPKQDKQKFIKLHSILYAMDQFDIQPALNWIAENEQKEEKKDEDNDEDDAKEKQKDINFTSKYELSKYCHILRFLLHRDKFLHISAIGSKQEMHSYMRSELEKLRNTKYNNTYSQEMINNLHYEASSIAYYVDDWKLLYYLKIFPNIKLNEIPATLNAESFQKYCNAITQCTLNQQQKDAVDPAAAIKEEIEPDHNHNTATNETNDIEMAVINNKKRKHMNETSEDTFDANLNINNNISPRKKRKISEKSSINNLDDKYNVSHLLQDESREYLSMEEKLSIYECFEFPQLIGSVWNLSRKAFTSAFMSIELDLPSMSGIQSCVELSLNIFPKFRDIADDISGDFDDILTLYKDFNKERSIRSRVPFTNALIAHSEDTQVQNVNGVSLSISNVFKWEDYDTLGEDESSSEDGNVSRSRSHSQSRSRSQSDGDAVCVGFELFKKDDEDKKGRNKSKSKGKQQKGRFRIHSEDNSHSHGHSVRAKSNGSVVKRLKYQEEDDGDDKEDNKDGMEEEDEVEGDYGDYDDASNDMRMKEEDVLGVDGYIGYMNRKEFGLDMKKRRIIRRSKNKEYKDRMDKYRTAEFLYNQIHPFIEQPNKKKRSKHKLTRPTTIILSNRSRTHRYDSRGVQRPHSLPSSQRHRSRIQPAVHRIRTQTTPPPPSDSDAAEEAFILHRNLNINQQLNIPHLHRAARPTSAQSANANDNDNDEVFTHIRRSQHRRLYSQNLVHRSIQQQFSPPPSNHAPLLLGAESLLAPRVVNENEANNDDLVGFDGDLSSMLNPSIFASRSSSPLSSQLTGMTLEHLSMTNNAPSTNAAESICDEEQTNNDDMAAQALLLLKNSKQNESNDAEDTVMDNQCKKESTKHKNGHKNGKTDKEEIDDDDAKSMEIDNENEAKCMENNANAVCNIDWENESDSSEEEERYLTQKDKDILRNEQRRLKISCKMSEDFKMPDGYLSHSIFVCPIQTDYVPDPQTKLGCGHLISYQTFVRLQNMQRQRHQENRNRPLKIHCPNCDQQSDVEKDVRYVYLGRFPDLRVDPRFMDILDKKLDANATKWVPGATQINGQE